MKWDEIEYAISFLLTASAQMCLHGYRSNTCAAQSQLSDFIRESERKLK